MEFQLIRFPGHHFEVFPPLLNDTRNLANQFFNSHNLNGIHWNRTLPEKYEFMTEPKTRLAINGAAGRMGNRLIDLGAQDDFFEIGLDHSTTYNLYAT